jgi:hypothetical protein
MTPEETLTRVAEYPDFHRLANGLKTMIIDFDYKKTRKALEPNWNPYSMPKGHDIIADDCALMDANLVTSQVKGTNLHRIVLDLDYGAQLEPAILGRRMRLNINKDAVWSIGSDDWMKNSTLLADLNACGIPHTAPHVQRAPYHTGLSTACLDITTAHDVALIPSSTPGHHHLIIKTDVEWDKYVSLMRSLAVWGIIEPGYAKASISKGYSAIRPPWVHK